MSGFCGRRVGFLRGSGLNSADRKRRAGIRIRGVRTSRLLVSRFEFESRSWASILTVSEGQLRRNNRECLGVFCEVRPRRKSGNVGGGREMWWESARRSFARELCKG